MWEVAKIGDIITINYKTNEFSLRAMIILLRIIGHF